MWHWMISGLLAFTGHWCRSAGFNFNVPFIRSGSQENIQALAKKGIQPYKSIALFTHEIQGTAG